MDPATQPPRLLRRTEVERLTSISRSRLYELIASGGFPRPIRLGANSVAWLESDITAWIAERVRERDAGRATP